MEQDITLKTDRAGRVRVPRERRQQIVAEWGKSGLSAMRFAAAIGVKYQNPSGWIRRHGGRGGAGSAAMATPIQPHWMEMAVSLGSVRASSGLRVELPGGAALVVGDAGQIPLVIQLLRALS